MMKNILLLSILAMLLMSGCASKKGKIKLTKVDNGYILSNTQIKLHVDSLMRVNISRLAGNKEFSFISNDKATHFIVVNEDMLSKFLLDKNSITQTVVQNRFGYGYRFTLSGTARGPLDATLEKKLHIELYDSFPNAALLQTDYYNLSNTKGLYVTEEVNNNFGLDASLVNKKRKKFDFWILQGGSYESRPDWIVPVTDNFSAENYQGQHWSKSKAGGGTPVLDIWNKESGMLIGSIRKKTTLISLPAKVDKEGKLAVSIRYKHEHTPFDSVYSGLPTVICVHEGDFFNGLRTYVNIMDKNGLHIPQPNKSDPVYNPVYCGWGFGPNFTMKQMIDIIPLVKEIGLKVVTVDMGWFYLNGDYEPRDDTFPKGDTDMIRFVQKYHDEGLKVKLWLTPCIAGPKLMKEHPEWLLKDKDGKVLDRKIYLTEKRAAYLCPALPEVQEYFRKLTEKIIHKWGFDGFKMDQSLINSISPCYAKEHQHKRPEDAVEALPKIYEIIAETTRSYKPEAIIEVCPCGMFPDFYKMPYYNQPIVSDPNTPWQVRHRTKVLKALMGPHAAVLGDMLERRVYRPLNFASMIGAGGIPETMFVGKEEDNYHILRKKFPGYLSPGRKQDFKKWFAIYNKYRLSEGEYLNLYDLAYDKPETHAIKKDGVMYYAFYAPNWEGEVEFRGLDRGRYRIVDYVNNKEIGQITSDNHRLFIGIKDYLLVRALPESSQ